MLFGIPTYRHLAIRCCRSCLRFRRQSSDMGLRVTEMSSAHHSPSSLFLVPCRGIQCVRYSHPVSNVYYFSIFCRPFPVILFSINPCPTANCWYFYNTVLYLVPIPHTLRRVQYRRHRLTDRNPARNFSLSRSEALFQIKYIPNQFLVFW